MAVGRPREFDEQQALEAAMEVFWHNGFEGTSCGDLLDAMGVNSGSMYAAFGDKQALYDKAFDHYCETVFSNARGTLNGSGTPLENVRTLISDIGKYMATPECKGCFVANTLIEFGGNSKGVAEMARRVTKKMQGALEKNLKAARSSGELQDAVDPIALAAFLVNTIQGLNVMARADAGKKTINGIIKTTLTMLQ